MTPTYRIDTDVTLWRDEEARQRHDYPFAQLEVGHSFLVPYAEGPTIKAVKRRVATAVYRQHLRDPLRRYTVRTQADGVRVGRKA